MGKGHKSRKDFQNIIDFPELDLNIKLPQDLYNKLRFVLNRYKAHKEALDNRPRITEQEAALEELNKLSRNLLNFLKKFDAVSRARLMDQSDWIDLDEQISRLEILCGACKDALNQFPPRTRKERAGRPTKQARVLCIESLCEIYEKLSGRKAALRYNEKQGKFYGPFFDFVNTCFSQLGEPPSDNYSLVQAIQEAIRKVKNYPDKISSLRERYGDQDLIDRTFQAIAATRKSGKVAPSVLLDQLQKWKQYPIQQVETGIRIYLDKNYASQGKNEKYLLKIISQK